MASPTQNRKQEPLVHLYGYQRGLVADPARFSFDCWSRQTGKDFSITLKHIRKRIRVGGDTICVAAAERQALQAIEKMKMHAAALKEAFEYEEFDAAPAEFPELEWKTKQVLFKHNKARFLAMPANPDTIRGFSGDVWLNEFAFVKNPLLIWKAAFAISSRGYTVDVSSTPNGQQGKFWDLAKSLGISPLGGHTETHWTAKGWSIHWCDIHTAIAQGCPMNAAELKQGIDDDDTWMQEYELIFLADAENYIPMELVVACETDSATLALPDPFVARECYLGVDIGRKKDRTVIWIVEKLGDVIWTRMVETLERTPFKKQFEQIDSLMKYVRRACVDSTGIGAQIGEDLATKHGESKVEQVVFNIENKEKMATAVKTRFENRTVRIPGTAPIRRAINAVKRYNSPTGHFRFDAERTEAGHADEFWALALANAAASGPSVGVDVAESPNKAAHAMAAGY